MTPWCAWRRTSPSAVRWWTARATSAPWTATARPPCVTPRRAWPSSPWRCCADLDKETVDFYPNFDETLMQPAVLPARFPNLLVNGSQRHRRGHGHQHPAAQPGRGHRRRSVLPDRQPGLHHGRPDAVRQGAGLPHRRRHPRAAAASTRPTTPAAASIIVRAKTEIEEMEQQPPAHRRHRNPLHGQQGQA